jgi:hypothetical protein
MTLMLLALHEPAYGAANLLKLVGTETMDATLTVGTKTAPIKARVSFALTATPADLKVGKLTVVQFNVLGLGVPQQKLTGKQRRGKKTGPLGFSITPGPRHPTLRYDASRPGISGKLSGRVGFPQLEELFPPKPDPRTDVDTTPARCSRQRLPARDVDGVAAAGQVASANREAGTRRRRARGRARSTRS